MVLSVLSKHLKVVRGYLSVCESISESFIFWVKSIKACTYIGKRPGTCCRPDMHYGPAAEARKDPSKTKYPKEISKNIFWETNFRCSVLLT